MIMMVMISHFYPPPHNLFHHFSMFNTRVCVALYCVTSYWQPPMKERLPQGQRQ